jgi:FkbM family methyltransferase
MIPTHTLKEYSKYSISQLKLHGALYNGDIANIFLENVYRDFPVEGKIVIDIGANIGDSCIYFALRGAEKVIGVEPFPIYYEIAKKNVELNNLSDRITMVLAGCSGKQGHINIDPSFEKGIFSKLSSGSNGDVAVPLMTLESILQQNKVGHRQTALKVDCEGCEYDIIMNSEVQIFENVTDLVMEYHGQYKPLMHRMEKLGFRVKRKEEILYCSKKIT